MEQLVQFLFKFYQAGHLQQIRHLSIKPLENAKGQENSKTLKLSISIEALSLPGATRPDKLSSEPGKVLAAPSLEQYVKMIVGRNLFSPYTPSGQAPRPVDSNPPQFDLAKYAYLTASVIDVRGRPQVWLKSRAENDKTLTLSQGDEFTIGPVHGKVTRIDRRCVEVEIDGAHVTNWPWETTCATACSRRTEAIGFQRSAVGFQRSAISSRPEETDMKSFSRPSGMGKGSSTHTGSLRRHRGLPAGRALRTDKSNPPCQFVDPGQYRRGVWTQRRQRTAPIP